MAKSNIPSQDEVPRQVKFPRETAANMGWKTTARPRTNASSGFPGEFPQPDVETYYGMNAKNGEFNYPSHTNGKKKD